MNEVFKSFITKQNVGASLKLSGGTHLYNFYIAAIVKPLPPFLLGGGVGEIKDSEKQQ